MQKLLVWKVLDNHVVCLSSLCKMVNIDTDKLLVSFCPKDEIIHVNNGFCKIYRNGILIGELDNLFTRMFVFRLK